MPTTPRPVLPWRTGTKSNFPLPLEQGNLCTCLTSWGGATRRPNADTEVLFIEMQPEEGSYEPLIGYIPLEQAQAAVDMLGHRLIKVSLVDLK